MMITTEMRARHNLILNRAIRAGQAAGMEESEIFERLVHFLLDEVEKHDEEKLTEMMNSVEPPVGFKRTNGG